MSYAILLGGFLTECTWWLKSPGTLGNITPYLGPTVRKGQSAKPRVQVFLALDASRDSNSRERRKRQRESPRPTPPVTSSFCLRR